MDYIPPVYPAKIIFIRHAQSEGNILTTAERAVKNQGTDSYRLTALGRQQARMTGAWMKKHFPHPDVILRSYYERTRETSDIIFPGQPKVDEPLLAERDRGAWHVLTQEELERDLSWEIRRRDRTSPFHFRPIGGESMADVERRVRELRRSLRCNYPGKTVVLVGHAHWLLLLLKLTNRWTIEETMTRLKSSNWAQNASVLIFRPSEPNPETGKQRLLHNADLDLFTPWEGTLEPGAAIP